MKGLACFTNAITRVVFARIIFGLDPNRRTLTIWSRKDGISMESQRDKLPTLPPRPQHYMAIPVHGKVPRPVVTASDAKLFMDAQDATINVMKTEARYLNEACNRKEQIISEAIKTIAGLRLELEKIGLERDYWKNNYEDADASKIAGIENANQWRSKCSEIEAALASERERADEDSRRS